MMNYLLEAILPQRAALAARDLKDRVRLLAIPRLSFDLTHLRCVNYLVLNTIFSNPALEDSWHAGHDILKGLLGEGEWLGGINPGDRRALYYLVRALKPGNVLEVGTHIGVSTLYIAHALKANGNQGRVSTVDIVDVNDRLRAPWKEAGLQQPPKDLASRANCLNAIEFVTSGSLDFMRRTERKFDFIFLDGDHAAYTVYREVAAALSLLKPQGMILLHDYYPQARPLFPDGKVISGPSRAFDRIGRENPALTVQPLGALPWQTKQGSNITSLALVAHL